MALQKQIVRMSADGGIDTKTDEKNVLPTDFLELVNVVFTKTKAWSKRFGYLAYPKNILESVNTIETGAAATTFKNELLRYSQNNLYSWIESEQKWADKGVVDFALASEYGVTTNGDKLLLPTHDTINNLTCYVYDRISFTTSGCEYRIIDSDTGSVVFTDVITWGANPFVIGVQGQFYIFYTLSGSLKFRTINFSTPSQISTETNVVTGIQYSVAKIGNRVYFAAPGVTGVQVGFIQNGAVGGPISVADAASFDVVAVSAEQGTNVRVTYGKSTGSLTVKTVLLSTDLNYQIHAPVTLAATQSAWNIASIQDPLVSNQSHIYVSGVDAPYGLLQYKITSAGTVTSTATIMHQATLQSTPNVINSKVYFAICKNSSYMAAGAPYYPFRTYFLASEAGEIITKFTEEGGVFRTSGNLPQLVLDGDTLSFAGAEAAEIQSAFTVSYVRVSTTVKKYTSNFSALNNYFDTSLGDNLHIAGGVLKMYDGDRVVEHNFLEIPQAPELISETGVGGILQDGSYQYVTVYKWIDKWGQTHRSSPSLPLTYVVTGGPKRPTIRLFTLSLTNKTDVEIEVYRTEANGTIFYKVAFDYNDKVTNDPSVESISYQDTHDDESVIANEALYTTGGVLENVSCDSSKYVTTYKGRVFALLSDGYTLQYSKKREQRGPVEFCAEFKIQIDSAGGPATSLAVMDDHLVILKTNGVYAMSGEGPNALGEQDDFREPQSINADCGNVDANSIVTVPTGIMFKSEKGLYLLGRDFKPLYLGAPAERYNSLTITSATLLPKTNQVRFTTNSEVALVYDYFVGKWTTFSNINAVDSVIYNGTYHYLRSNGQLMRETPGLYSDNGSYISMALESAWIQIANIQGFERFYKLMVLGSYKNAHNLKVRFAYDFNPAWDNEVTINAGQVLETDVYGTGLYGEETPYGGNFPLYQFRIFPKRQKCESFKFSIKDFKTDGNGEAFSLSNIAAEIGLKPTSYKKSKATSFGAT
jgi:hypothetical protein